MIDAQGQYLGVLPLLQHADGYLLDAPEHRPVDHPLHAVSVVARRDAYEHVGGFRPGLVHANHWEMWAR